MSRYEFITDRESEPLCDEVVQKMVRLFGITELEALDRINRHWSGLEFVGEGSNWLMHEDPEYWAKLICYGPDVHWWNGEAGLKLKPYP